MRGIVYVLSHPAMPGLLKIGYTDRSLKERLRELESTGVPGKFNVDLYFYTNNAKAHELALHRTLRKYRFKKEFFQIKIIDAIILIKEITNKTTDDKIEFYGTFSFHFKAEGSENIRFTIRKNTLEEAKEIAEENQKLASMSYEELKIKYHNAYRSYERKIIEPFYKSARDRVILENSIKAKEGQKLFNNNLDEFISTTKQLNYLIEKNKPFTITFGLLGYDVLDGYHLGKKILNNKNYYLMESFIKIYRGLYKLNYLPNLKCTESYPEKWNPKFIFIDGDLRKIQPIFDGIWKYFNDLKNEIAKSESSTSIPTQNEEIPKSVETDKQLIEIDQETANLNPSYYLSSLEWYRTREGIHCETLGEFYENDDFELMGDDVVFTYKNKKWHIPKIDIIDFYLHETANFKFQE